MLVAVETLVLSTTLSRLDTSGHNVVYDATAGQFTALTKKNHSLQQLDLVLLVRLIYTTDTGVHPVHNAAASNAAASNAANPGW
jgi:hypothetical protein